VKKQRIEGVGTLEVRMEVKNGIIKDINLKGDFFLIGDLNEIRQTLKNQPLDRMSMEKVLPDTKNLIVNLSKTDLITLILK